MDKKFVEAKALTIKAYEQEVKQLQTLIESLKDEIKFAMSAEDVEEVVTDLFTVRWKEVPSNRFDTNAFKKENVDLYKRYFKEGTTKRFTID